jgi:hypothetical protein
VLMALRDGLEVGGGGVMSRQSGNQEIATARFSLVRSFQEDRDPCTVAKLTRVYR